MRQVTDPRAPFPDVGTASRIAEEFVRSQGGDFGFFEAKPQHGGYFVEVTYAEPCRVGSRHARNKRVTRTVEIGRIAASDLPGTEEGQLCRRDGCAGVIELIPEAGERECFCHISPPCGYCVSTMPECPVCSWRMEE